MDKQYAAKYVAKPVLMLDGKVLGIVKSAVFAGDLSRIVGLSAFDESTEEEFVFDLRCIYRAGESAILLAGEPRLPRSNWRSSPVGLAAFSLEGDYLGRVSDVALDGDRAVALVTEDGEYPMDRVVAAGEGAAVVDTAEPRTKLPAKKRRARPGAAKSAPEALAAVAATEAAAPAAEIAEEAPLLPPEAGARPEEGVPEPARIVCGDKLLIGRKLKRNIVNQKGEIVAREGERITKDVLEKAKKFGLLFELTVGSLSNLL